MKSNIYVTAYGKDNVDRGIHLLSFEGKLHREKYLSLSGKCNLVLQHESYLILSVKYANENKLEIYDFDFNFIKSFECEYFYSYGHVKNNKCYLASYENGVDSVFDLENECFISHNIHKKEGSKAKSHYIKCLDDKIIGIENGLQQFIIYKNDSLEIERVIQYPPINIRLLSFHPNGKYAYMNTEFSNEIIVLDMNNFSVLNRVQMVEQEGWYSGGNAISLDGRYICSSIRGEDAIYVFETFENQLKLVKTFNCGKNPRDLIFINEYLFVTCTDDHCIEVYDREFNKIDSLEMNQPITFGLK